MESKKKASHWRVIKCMSIYTTSLFFRKICAIAEMQIPQYGFCHEQSPLKVLYLPFLIISQSLIWIPRVPDNEFSSLDAFCSAKQNLYFRNTCLQIQ